jgi:long-subunit acyl-CoA synthetase (AMP-forming)
MVDLAVLDLRAVDVPVYGTLTPAQVAYQINDSGAKAAVAENAEQMRKLLAVRDGCPSLEHLIQIEGAREPGVLDADGWFRTGDIAEIDDDGFLLIVDRKKDIIVTAGGKNVAPQPIESLLKRSPCVDAAVLIGDRRPFITALISPNFEELERWARANHVVAADRADLVEQPRTRELYREVVDATNAGLARYEQIKQFRVVPVSLSIEAGHLTPTLKVRRRVIGQQFAHLIDHMYEESEDLGSGG